MQQHWPYRTSIAHLGDPSRDPWEGMRSAGLVNPAVPRVDQELKAWILQFNPLQQPPLLDLSTRSLLSRCHLGLAFLRRVAGLCQCHGCLDLLPQHPSIRCRPVTPTAPFPEVCAEGPGCSLLHCCGLEHNCLAGHGGGAGVLVSSCSPPIHRDRVQEGGVRAYGSCCSCWPCPTLVLIHRSHLSHFLWAMDGGGAAVLQPGPGRTV